MTTATIPDNQQADLDTEDLVVRHRRLGQLRARDRAGPQRPGQQCRLKEALQGNDRDAADLQHPENQPGWYFSRCRI